MVHLSRYGSCGVWGVALVLMASGPSDAVGVDGPPRIGTDVGQMYPDFLLPTLDGAPGRLSDFRGKKVLLIHFASW